MIRKLSLIAVVASDPDYGASLRDLLASAGYKVVTLRDAGQALDAIDASPPDLVVAGLSPAHLEGWAVCRLLRSSTHASLNEIPVLIVPADIQGEEAARITAELCGNAILPFSVGRERLLAQVEAILDRGVRAQAPQIRAEGSCTLHGLATYDGPREGEEPFAAAFEHFPAAASISTLDDGTFLQVNRHFEAVFGFRREELIGRSCSALGFLPWERRSDLRRLLELRGRLSGVEVQLRARGGRVIYCLVNVEVIRMGGQDRALTMLLDITDRRQMEETIRQSDERLRLTLDATNTVAWEINACDRSIHETGPLDRLFGRATEVAHANVAEFAASIHPADRDRVLGAIDAALRGEGEYRG